MKDTQCLTNFSVQYFKILCREEIYKKLHIYIKLSLANEFLKSLKFKVRTKSGKEFHSLAA